MLYFRISIPKDIQYRFPTREIYRSLNTASIKQASGIAQVYAAALKQLFGEIRSRVMTNEELEKYKRDNAKLLNLIKTRRYESWIRELEVESAEKSSIIANQERRERSQDTVVSALAAKSAKMQPIGDGRPLSAYIPIYLQQVNAVRESTDQLPQKTLDSYQKSCLNLVEIIGDKPLHQLTHVDRNRYDDVIIRMPKNREKMPATRGKSLAEVLAMTEIESVSLKTAKFEALRANQFLQWVFRHEHQRLPFKLLEAVKVKKNRGTRRPFSPDELRVLFDSNSYPYTSSRDRSPYKHWVPLIALHTGARINEIAQLPLSDIVEIDDVHCFKFTEDLSEESNQTGAYLGKSIKTASGTRIVPIHSRLVELGLLEYVAAGRTAKHHLLCEDLAHAASNYGQLASKWFAYYCDSVGLTDKRLVFHSFRHTVTTEFEKKKIPQKLYQAIIGHSSMQTVTDSYIDHNALFSIVDKKEAIEALDFSSSLDFAALKNKAPTIGQLNEAISRKLK